MRGISKTVFSIGLLLGLLFSDDSGGAAAEEGGTPPPPRITFHTNAEGVRGVKLRLYLRTTPDQVWEVVTNRQKAAQLFPAITSITNSSKGPSYREYHLTSIIGDKMVVCRIDRDDTRRRIHWQRVEGHLDELMGWYHISTEEQYPGYTRIDYGSFIDPGFIGRALMTNRGRRRDVNYMISQFRRFTESGPAK